VKAWSSALRNSGRPINFALFNTATSGSATVSVNWSQVGFTGGAAVTDLWSGASGGTVANSYSATLRPGEARLIRAVPTGAPAADLDEIEVG
jgi:hypothetical protein